MTDSNDLQQMAQMDRSHISGRNAKHFLRYEHLLLYLILHDSLYLFGKANSEILIMDCEDGHFPLNIKVICCSSNHLDDKISKYIEKTQFPKAQGDIFVSSFVVKKQKILTFQKLEQEKDELFITVIDDSFSAI